MSRPKRKLSWKKSSQRMREKRTKTPKIKCKFCGFSVVPDLGKCTICQAKLT